MSCTGATITERADAVLRLLGRVGLARTESIQELIFPQHDRLWVYEALRMLRNEELVWEADVTAVCGTQSVLLCGRILLVPQLIYGLTPEGRTSLLERDIEANAADVVALPVHTWNKLGVEPKHLHRHVLASDWCCAMLKGARQHTHLANVQCLVNPISATSDATQCFDVFFSLTLACTPVWERPIWELPWDTRLSKQVESHTYRFLAAVQVGCEQSERLSHKASIYRQLSQMHKVSRGELALPVLLLSDPACVAHIAREWLDCRLEASAVVTDVVSAQLDGDAVRGQYVAVTSHVKEQLFLLEPFGITRAAWEAALRQ